MSRQFGIEALLFLLSASAVVAQTSGTIAGTCGMRPELRSEAPA
jgi:hypothetical protein